MQAQIDSQFTVASDYLVIRYKERETDVYNNIGVRISSWYSPTSADLVVHDNIKKITFSDIEQKIYLGDIFEFENYRWIVIITDNVASITQSCAVQRCNFQMKFIDSTNDVMPSTPIETIYSLDAICDIKTYIPIEDRYVLLPSNTMIAKVPNTSVARRIKDAPKGTRFLLGNPLRAWRTIGIDTITDTFLDINNNDSNGIITLMLQLDAINVRVDNTTAKLAKQYS
jgi:hypothetical protein